MPQWPITTRTLFLLWVVPDPRRGKPVVLTYRHYTTIICKVKSFLQFVMPVIAWALAGFPGNAPAGAFGALPWGGLSGHQNKARLIFRRDIKVRIAFSKPWSVK